MGLFGEKENCSICGGKVSALLKFKLKDGVMCNKCSSLCGSEMISWNTKSIEDVKKRLQHREENRLRLQVFSETDCVGLYIKIDSDNKTWIVPKSKKYIENNVDVFDFSDIIDYELIEDGRTLTKGGIGGAVVGGALLGGVGAIVGGNASKKNKSVVNKMYVRISLKHKWIKHITINLIATETKKNGVIYNMAKSSAEKILSLLDYIVSQTAPDSNTNNFNMVSPADEILKFKNLFDAGTITEEEFNVKKKQLLGL